MEDSETGRIHKIRDSHHHHHHLLLNTKCQYLFSYQNSKENHCILIRFREGKSNKQFSLK
ncbi:CLUMA_CG007902, isoform A [Clunio marinus]|uniref:CLUMA_CG007902, isoform A n=1 Tax=Clunio marinus TaxID=568069 RepID=A0A1J1I2F6_9DIPT|nr:CLUMA_CG007902, isoform A [Clunio marinus]